MKLSTITAAAVALAVYAATPAGAAEYACTDGMKLTMTDDAVTVTAPSGKTATMTEWTFTGEDNVFTPSGKATSCEGQSACVSGICNDTFCYYDVSIGDEWGRCIARNDASEE